MENTHDLSEFFDDQPDEALAHEFISKGRVTFEGRRIEDTDELPLTVRENIARVQRKYSDRFDITTENIVAEYAKCAFFNPQDLFSTDGKLKGFHELDSQTSAAIAGMKITQVGGSQDGWIEQIHYKFADKLKALDALGKVLGLFKDNVVIGEDAKAQVSDNEKARRLAFVLERLLLERAKGHQSKVA